RRGRRDREVDGDRPRAHDGAQRGVHVLLLGRQPEDPGGRLMRSSARWLLGHPWYAVLTVGAVLFAWWAIGTRSQPHHVRVAFPTAFNLTKGLDVQVDGMDVGKVGDVKYVDGQAIVQ